MTMHQAGPPRSLAEAVQLPQQAQQLVGNVCRRRGMRLRLLAHRLLTRCLLSHAVLAGRLLLLLLRMAHSLVPLRLGCAALRV